MNISPARTSFQSPWQNGVAERWVESCRRDLLDHGIALNERHLRRLLSDYVRYYHEDRTHLDLDLIFALQYQRTVNRDNTVSIQNLQLQIEPVRWRATLAGCIVTVHQHLDGTFRLTHGPQRLGHYSAEGVPLENAKSGARRAVEKPRGGKVINPTFPPRLEIPQKPRDSHFPTASATAGSLTQTGQVTC
jgi:hypothetical protein